MTPIPTTPFVSIIIPVGQISENFYHIVSAVSAKDPANVELIIVNDISIDKPKMVTSRFPRKSIFIEGHFGGPGLARNAGLEVASGDWVTFWDSDDFGIVENLIALVALCISENTEIGIGQYRKITQSPRGKNVEVVSLSTLEDENIFPNPGLWRWVFNKRVIGDKRFINSKMGEDQAFIFALEPFDKKISRLDNVVYEYFLHDAGQLTKNKSAMKDLSITISYITDILPSTKGLNRAFGEFIVERLLLTGIRKGSINTRISYSGRFLLVVFSRIWSKNGVLLFRAHLKSLHKE